MLNHKLFYEMIKIELNKRNWGYRDAQKNFGIQKDVFTGLHRGENIRLTSFLILVYWLKTECNYTYSEIMNTVFADIKPEVKDRRLYNKDEDDSEIGKPFGL